MRSKKENNKTAVVTIIYKKGLPFFIDYFRSLDRQKTKNFDLLLFNSDIEKRALQTIETYVDKECSLNYKIIHLGKGPIGLLWNKVIRFLVNSNYSKFIFADFDDYFSSDRISVLDYWLEKEPMVFHDLNLFFNKTGKIVRNYFAKLIPPIIDWKYLVDQNCIGLGNSAIRREVLFSLTIPREIKAVDWYLFANIMMRKSIRAKFIRKSLTYYRQYSMNMASLVSLDRSKVAFALKVKYLHYKHLIKFFKNDLLSCKYANTHNLIKLKQKKSYYDRMIKKHLNKRTCWWQYAEA